MAQRNLAQTLLPGIADGKQRTFDDGPASLQRAGVRLRKSFSGEVNRGDRQLIVSLPENEPDRSHAGRAMARELVRLATTAPAGQRGWLIESINEQPAASDPTSQYLIEAGFAATSQGLQLRIPKPYALRPTP